MKDITLKEALNLPNAGYNIPAAEGYVKNHNKEAYVAQHEAAFLPRDNIHFNSLRTQNIGQCIAVTTHSQSGVSLTHVDTQTSKESLKEHFYNLPEGKHDVKLFGGKQSGKQTTGTEPEVMESATKANAEKILSAFNEANKDRVENGKGALDLKSADIGDKKHSTSASIGKDGEIKYDPIGYTDKQLNRNAQKRDDVTIIRPANSPVTQRVMQGPDEPSPQAGGDVRNAIREKVDQKLSKEELFKERRDQYQSYITPENKSQFNTRAKEESRKINTMAAKEIEAQHLSKEEQKLARHGNRIGSAKASEVKRMTNQASIDLGDDSKETNQKNMRKILEGASYQKPKSEMLLEPKNWRNAVKSKINGKEHTSTNLDVVAKNINTHNDPGNTNNKLKIEPNKTYHLDHLTQKVDNAFNKTSNSINNTTQNLTNNISKKAETVGNTIENKAAAIASSMQNYFESKSPTTTTPTVGSLTNFQKDSMSSSVSTPNSPKKPMPTPLVKSKPTGTGKASGGGRGM